jgi:hypothetical protein
LVDQAGRSLGGLIDLAELLERSLVFESSQEQVGIPADNDEEIVEVVCHPAGQLANGIHLLRLQQALLELATAADVDGHPAQLESAVLEAKDADLIANPHDLTLGIAHAIFVLVILAAADCLAKIELGRLEILRMDDRVPEAILILPARERIPEHLLRPPARERKPRSFGIRLPDDRVDLTEDRCQSLAAGLRLGMRGLLTRELQAFELGGSALADVANDGDDELLLTGCHRAEADLDGKLASVLTTTVELEAGAHFARSRIVDIPRSVRDVSGMKSLGDQFFDLFAN